MKLEIRDLTVSYDTGVVLNDLSLNMEEGEFLSLLGPSGCGKTTLMKAVAGILPVEKGTITLDGEDITGLPIHKRGTVIVFQDMRLFPHMTVADNVAFPLKMQGVDKKKRLERAHDLLEKVQMEGYENRLPSVLSGGQQQRVALARALASQPKLLLLDEPFSALDENLREDMRRLVLELRRAFGMTVLLVTHDREEALSMSDRVAVMFGGKLLQTGTPRQVYARPVSRQVADYFGDCIYLPRQEGVLLLRPAALQPETPGDYPLTVESLQFRGGDTLVTFRGDDGTVWKKSYGIPPAFQPGDRILAALNTENGVFFSNK